MHVVGFDTETGLMGDGAVQPPVVCLSLAARPAPGAPVETQLVAGDDAIVETFAGLLANPDVLLVGANTAYDTAGPFLQYPALRPAILDAFIAGRFDDVVLREMLWNLSTAGVLKSERTPNGGDGKPILYSLAELEKRRLGRDRTGEKEGDAWRFRYAELKGVPVERWPANAVKYAIEDAEGTLLVWEDQERGRRPRFHGSMNTSRFQTFAAFCLRLWEEHGFRVDPDRVAQVEAHLEDLLSPERMAPLYEAGLLSPRKPPRPYKKRESKKPKTAAQLEAEAEKPVKMTKEVPEKLNKKALQEHVFELSRKHGVRLVPTDKAIEKRIPHDELEPKHVSVGGEVLRNLIPYDPVLEILADRQDHAKIKTTFLPNLKGEAGRFHPGYNVLVSSGRTSCRTVKDKKKQPIYPSGNVQNLPAIGGIRECLLPDEGCLLLAIDYSALELCSVAQTTKDVVGFSKHLEALQSGKDLHAYLGSALAANLDADFREHVRGMSREEVYAEFTRCKTHGDPELAAFFKHYRKFAKPTGLGYPGGLGPRTFIDFARNPYEVHVTLEEATRLRELWHETYPEMREFFRWVNRQLDHRNFCAVKDRETGLMKTQQRYAFETPMGMWRAGCLFTEIANGKAMQSPSAEGAKAAVIETTLACFDPRRADGVLFGCRPAGFVHDEIIINVPDDGLNHERAEALSRIMIEQMEGTFPDVPIRTEAALMRRWNKAAETVLDGRGRLAVWEEPEGEEQEVAA